MFTTKYHLNRYQGRYLCCIIQNKNKLRQYSQYTVIGRTALVTSQIQGKWLSATEIKGDKQDNKLSALINQRSN